MKFNEKLIELRKKEGLSQEELGYKLNVTRQTVSKWELGQTTPEMEKLKEISKIFNTSVDELINESDVTSNHTEVIEDKPIENGEGRNKKIVIILVVALIIVVGIIGLKMFTAMSIFNKFDENAGGYGEQTGVVEGFFSRIFNLMDKQIDKQEDMLNGISTNKIQDMFENTFDEISKKEFNSKLELYIGNQKSISLQRLLDDVITINKTTERKVTVKYLETKTQDVEEIKNLKNSFKDTYEYDISFEYDKEGYIYEIAIEKIISEFEVNRFNNSFEIFAGTKMGASIIHTLDSIITNNKTDERKITVKYLEIETQEETEIRNIKKKIDNFNNYELTYEYDEDGFIYKAIIEKF